MGRASVAACCALLFLALIPASAGALTARGRLFELHDSGAIDDATFQRDKAIYDDAKKSVGRLTGRRRNELRAVVSTIDAVAASGRLTAARLPMAFLTIDRNRAWWTAGRLLGYGERVYFPGSDLVWQSYPGQGIQVQWLGTFGRANALFTGGDRYNDRLAALLAEATALAAPRGGGIAWEYWFRFDSGSPPWVSALAQGTALQAYGRAAVRLGDTALFGVGRSALGIFQQPAPDGVRVTTPAGAHYLIYSFAPHLHVLNGFIQALNGLHDFGKLANEPIARQLFAEGEAEARIEVPKHDTGAWSLYSQARESDLGYHRLLRDFLQGLCDRLTADGEPDPKVYCDTATRFTKDLVTRPRIALLAVRPSKPRARAAVTVPFTLSKISSVTTRVTYRGKLIAGKAVRYGHGRHAVVFTPRKPGSYAISVRAIDLAGNAAAVSGAVAVSRARRG